jgi:hypothetical protein
MIFSPNKYMTMSMSSPKLERSLRRSAEGSKNLSLQSLLEGLPNDVKEVIDNKMLLDLHTRAEIMRNRTMPVPELHTAVPFKSGSQWIWPSINFEFQGDSYQLHINTTGENQGISLNKVLPEFSHILFFNPPYHTLTVMNGKDEKILPLVQVMLTIIRRFVPSATPQNITVLIHGSENMRGIPLTDFMKRIKTVDGGAKPQHSNVKFEGSVYKLHTSKTNGDYIIVGKKRVHLKDIRRRYRFAL